MLARAILIAPLALCACNSQVVARALVGPAGGTVSTADGTSVIVPAGALTEMVTISIMGSPNAPPPDGLTPVGGLYSFSYSPQPLDGPTFAKAVTVRLGIVAPSLSIKDSVVVYTAVEPVDPAAYMPLPTAGDDDPSHVRALATHFSVFVPCVPNPPDLSVADASID
jgi:hypothetical protein